MGGGYNEHTNGYAWGSHTLGVTGVTKLIWETNLTKGYNEGIIEIEHTNGYAWGSHTLGVTGVTKLIWETNLTKGYNEGIIEIGTGTNNHSSFLKLVASPSSPIPFLSSPLD
jgi:hypothetical protein